MLNRIFYRAFVGCFSLLIVLLSSSCSKQSETLNTEVVNDYFPLVPGKYIVYQLDSSTLLPFGTGFRTTLYQIKDEVEAAITDGSGRPSFRIQRYIRDADGQQEWRPISTILATHLPFSAEVSENNLRMIKLMQPIRNNFSWKGNSYIDTYSASSTLKYLDNWDYIYEMVHEPFLTPMKRVDSTITVQQRDETIGSVLDKNNYYERNYGIEIYGKGIGMIYKEFIHHEYQPGNTPPASGRFIDGSYSIKLTMIDHN